MGEEFEEVPSMPGTGRATMRDVAQASGVSRTTVSFVLNDTADQTIPETTRERVRRAAEDLGYVPHSIARALREGASRIVVLEAGGLPRGHSLESFIDGLDEELSAAGHGLLVSYGDRSRASTRTVLDAVSPRAVIDLPALYSRPDRDVADGGWIDGLAAHAMTQVSYLRSRGHLVIATAVPTRPDPIMALLDGHVRAAARELGMPEPRSLPVDETGATAPDLRAVTRDAPISAVAALTDDLALGVLAAMADLGLTAPRDLAVIGFDDTRHGSLWRLALTTVHIDARAYGRRTARAALGLPAGDSIAAPARVIQRASA
ncbi:LacI family DNA-binding transcriptional regulator [Streptosporangium lutulentum]